MQMYHDIPTYANFDNFWTCCEVPAGNRWKPIEDNAITIENDQGCTPTALDVTTRCPPKGLDYTYAAQMAQISFGNVITGFKQQFQNVSK